MSDQVAKLALVKQIAVSGGDTNYYLQLLDNGTAVECEDVIERCDMRYADGCTFKAIWRLCKDRQGLGKPGSTPIYEADKNFYYSKRVGACTLRRFRRVNNFGRMIRFVRDLFSGNPFYDPRNIIIEVEDPKRLDPYSFAIGDLVDALSPTTSEAQVLIDMMVIGLMRLVKGPPRLDERDRCDSAVHHAKRIADREKLTVLSRAEKY